jgi:hypothetical protein
MILQEVMFAQWAVEEAMCPLGRNKSMERVM